MKLARSLATSAVGLGLLLAACGGSTDDSGGGGTTATGPTIQELPGVYAKAYCELVKSCLGPILDVYLGGEDCVTRLTKQVTDGDLSSTQSLVAAGKLTYDGSKVQACLDALKAGGCGQLDKRSPAACDAVFTGQAKTGDPCTVNEECPDGNYCMAGAACPGACTPRGGAGSSCTANDGCQDGLTCQGAKCAAPSTQGGACGSGMPECASGLQCQGNDDKAGKPGTCQTIASVFSGAPGADCDVITGKFCQAGSACELQTATMTALTFKCVSPHASGAACKIAVPDACPAGEYCPVDTQAGKFDGTCTKLPAAGQPCGKGINDVCEPYSVCVSGTCKAKQTIGGACSTAQECWSEVCKSGACAAGAACEPDQIPGN